MEAEGVGCCWAPSVASTPMVGAAGAGVDGLGRCLSYLSAFFQSTVYSAPSSVSSHLKDPQGTGTMRLCLHGNNRLYLGISWRPEPTGAAGFGPEYPPEACLACADRASVRGSSRDDGDHASSRQEQADGVALAGTLPRGRGRRTVAGSGPGVRQAPLGRRGEIAGVDEDDAGGTAERDPVECSHDGQGRRNQPVCRGSGPSMD